jgi:GrpB-like predicted nucleotidyltransferase (UPF0157 family)
MEWLTNAGFGLDDHTVRLERTTQRWLDVGGRLTADVALELSGLVAGVEQIGSSSVLGLAAKPIVDIAVGLTGEHQLGPVSSTLSTFGWVYRGDAGGSGGHVFILRTRPGHRVAHLHVVEHGGSQWRDYLALRDLLRSSTDACARYEAVKKHLAGQVGNDRVAYTDGKSDIIRQLLAHVT